MKNAKSKNKLMILIIILSVILGIGMFGTGTAYATEEYNFDNFNIKIAKTSASASNQGNNTNTNSNSSKSTSKSTSKTTSSKSKNTTNSQNTNSENSNSNENQEISSEMAAYMEPDMTGADVKNLEDIKTYLEKNKGEISSSDLLQAYKQLSEKYTNKEIANALESNRSLLEEKGINSKTLDSTENLLKNTDAKQLNKILSEDINLDDLKEQLENGASPSEILSALTKDMSVSDQVSLGANLLWAFGAIKVVLILLVILAIYNIVIRACIFYKAGEKGWKALIPIYRDIIWLKISDVSPWFLLLVLVPIIGWIILWIVDIYTKFTISEGFKKGIGFGFGMWLLAPIFEAILAFSKNSKYVGFDKKKV